MRRLLRAAALASTMLGCTAALQAQEPAPQPPSDNPDWLSEARIYAQDQGISLGEAVRRSRLQRVAGEQATRFADDPDFAGSWIDQDRTRYRITFAFKNGRQRELGDPDLAAVSDFTGARYSLKEIDDERKRLTGLLRSQGIDASFELRVRENQLALYSSDPARVRNLVSGGSLSLPDFVLIMEGPLVRRYEAAVQQVGQPQPH